jgi:hypothetical protein
VGAFAAVLPLAFNVVVGHLAVALHERRVPALLALTKAAVADGRLTAVAAVGGGALGALAALWPDLEGLVQRGT